MSPISSRTRFTFINLDGSAVTLVPSERAGRIAAIAAVFRGRLASGVVVGLLYKSEPNLVLAWLACVSAGLKPLILQYPTRKQARTYWFESIADTIQLVGIAGIVADDHCAGLLGSNFEGTIIPQAYLDGVPDVAACEPLPEIFTIVQLSSGTTGYRKAIEFSSENLARHISDYNLTLGLTDADKIASWLPLYHDMGYVACFVMLLMLGIDVIMMDPMTWVQKPDLLFDAIETHGATLCYMPNFGFEVMARCHPRSLPSMRRWISCSEPVSETTATKFLSVVGALPSSLSPCYAMAENIFAVTIGRGYRTITIDGTNVVSCGRPIDGVDLKTVEGEIWVRSPTSIVSYVAGHDIRDADGFYPTGDLGRIIDGELFVSGRKQDLLIQAGRKYLLSDIDLRLNELYPDIRGRAAALALRDERLGTEMPTVLIEEPNFFERTDSQNIAAALKSMTGLDPIEVAFVPPRFLTKTSSGKVNRRKTSADWIAVQAAWKQSRAGSRDVRTELADSFETSDWNRPVGEALDSLSQTILRIILDASPIQYDRRLTLNEIDIAVQQASAKAATKPVQQVQGIHIVSLSDKSTLRNVSEAHLQQLEEALGCPVSLEHVCLPPSPMVVSDLVFNDYFRPRLGPLGFTAVDHAMNQLKSASVILVDDIGEMTFLYESVYPVLSHNLERDPRADLISFRWQQYTKSHDHLPLTVVAGVDVPLSALAGTLRQLGAYLKAPIFRIALVPGFREYTSDWELCANGSYLTGLSPDEFVQTLAAWIKALPSPPTSKLLRTGSRLSMSDLGHFCSHMVSKEAIDQILASFDRFCIAGEKASLPYVRQKLEALNKPYFQVPSHSPEVMAGVKEEFDCLLLCGSVGAATPAVPVVALQHADAPWRTRNLGSLAESLPPLAVMPSSGTDWFHTFEFKPKQDYDTWSKARIRLAEERIRHRV
jgi:acyl-CoA synthetase (AMP-forming)/AMP-acid ligase II